MAKLLHQYVVGLEKYPRNVLQLNLKQKETILFDSTSEEGVKYVCNE